MDWHIRIAVAATAVLLIALAGDVSAVDPDQDLNGEAEGRSYMEYLNREYGNKSNLAVKAEWQYATNLTDNNLQYKLNVSQKIAKFKKEQWLETIRYPWKTYQDKELKRMFKKYSVLGAAALPDNKRARLEKIVSEMESIYSKTRVCRYLERDICNVELEPNITHIFATSRNNKKLKHYWYQWHTRAGRRVRKLFEEYVELSNEAAQHNNFTTTAEYWNDDFEVSDFEDQVANLLKQIEPLYKQLHAYVRKRLGQHYSQIVKSKGPIPAHLLGNVWAQSWGNIYNITMPFENVPDIDVTQEMKRQGYTPLKMFKLAEEFFTSLNLSAMPEKFWNNSVTVKPDGRDIICHASAWDFYDGEDFRIKMCTEITMEGLQTVHHEMGHIQYYLQYKDLPFVFKEGANSGFHEAIGDVIGLSVTTTSHLRKIGLLSADFEDNIESDINYLYLTALEKVAFLPFAYVMDLWRWRIFRGTITPDNYNCQWWKMRYEYSGIELPVNRIEKDFDAGAKYHIIADVPYIRYFVSYVIQFQFHKALCIKAGQYDPDNPHTKPLHRCDIYQSTEAGNVLGNMLRMGSSKPWPDAMEAITGEREMNASALLEYFSPLQKWLEEENSKTQEYIGWRPTYRHCVQTEEELEKLENEENKDKDTEEPEEITMITDMSK